MPARHPEGCLFCRCHDGGFRSREHIFSEALGNHEHILDPGIVCDRCNNGPLAHADNALSGFAPIALLRGERGIGGKTGRAPLLDLGGTQVWWSAKGELNVATNSRRLKADAPQRRALHTQGRRWELELQGQQWHAGKARAIVRSVWKSALEFIYLDHGAAAFDATYDSLREAVLNRALLLFPWVEVKG